MATSYKGEICEIKSKGAIILKNTAKWAIIKICLGNPNVKYDGRSLITKFITLFCLNVNSYDYQLKYH